MASTGMGRVTVRPARASDADAVARLTGQLGYDVEPSALGARLSSILARPDERFLIAEIEGRPVGWLHAAVREHVETDPFLLVGGLVVDRNHRRHGIGRLLMEHAERWAHEQGCPFVRLWSSSSRTDAHRFYERLGYSNIKTQYSFVKAMTTAGRDDISRLVPRVEDSGP